MRINIPWNRYALIVELADRLKHRCPQFGKTALQKMVYLLQEVYGVNCGYRFDLYTYGPFSSELLQDLDLVEGMEGVNVVPVISGMGGYQIIPGARSQILKKKAEEFLVSEKVSNALDKLVDEFGGYWAKDLELRSTILYVAKDLRRSRGSVSQTKLARTVKEIKPKLSEAEIQQAINEMLEKGYISLQ